MTTGLECLGCGSKLSPFFFLFLTSLEKTASHGHIEMGKEINWNTPGTHTVWITLIMDRGIGRCLFIIVCVNCRLIAEQYSNLVAYMQKDHTFSAKAKKETRKKDYDTRYRLRSDMLTHWNAYAVPTKWKWGRSWSWFVYLHKSFSHRVSYANNKEEATKNANY